MHRAMQGQGRTAPRWLCAAWLAVASTSALAQQAAAFRFSDLDLRDPHLFVQVIGCNDITNPSLLPFSVNGELQTRIQTDADGDGRLDLSYLVEFLPLDRTQPTNLMDFGGAECSAPLASTQCTQVVVSALAGDATLGPGTACLAPLPGTVRPYSPAVAAPSAPCFVSPAGTLTLDLGGIPITLREVALSASFVGDPGDALANGLLRGFISEADADATILPPALPLVGGRTLSSLLPGGTGNCAAFSDKDMLEGASGWWFYFNFPASRVAIADPFATGFSDGFEP